MSEAADVSAGEPHEVVEGCLDCPHPDICAGMGECEVAACQCGHPKSAHADCGKGPCRSNRSLALWHDGNDCKVTPCRCRSYFVPVETVRVES